MRSFDNRLEAYSPKKSVQHYKRDLLDVAITGRDDFKGSIDEHAAKAM